MWRQICHVEKFQISMHDRCGEIQIFSTYGVISDFSSWQMWRNLKFLHIWLVCDVENVKFKLFCCKIGIIAIYALLSRNLFGRDLRTFMWGKTEPKKCQSVKSNL